MAIKKTVLVIILISAATFFLLTLIHWDNIITSIYQFLRYVYNRFEYSYRFKIAYISGFILIAGTFILFLKKTPAETTFLKKVPAQMKSSKDTKKLILLSIIIISLFWSHFLFRGQDTHVKIFDNLDCHIPHTKILAESGKTFSLNPNTKIENFINGIALSGLDSGYNVLTWLFMIFPSFIAYAINDLLVRLVAILGMVLLLRKYIIKPHKEEHHWIIFGAALCFALLPFYPAGGISIAGIPLLLYSYLNIRSQEGKLTDFLIIFIFPFYSKLALAGFFIAIALTILFIVDCLRKKNINFHYLGGLALLTITYCFTHFHLLHSFLSPSFVSYREEISTAGVPSAKALKLTIDNFIFDRVNVVGAQHMFVMVAAALAIAVSIVKKVNVRLMKVLIAAGLLTSFLWGFKYWTGIIPLREKFQLLNAFDFPRFYWFNPFIWYVIFALALFIILRLKHGKILVIIFIIGQLFFLFINYNWEYRYLLGKRNSYAGSPLTYSLTYRKFYSESLFDEINRYINKPKEDYRVVSLGIHPGISQYNGFYTLDIYTDVYSLDYKHRFREIISRELEKSDKLRIGFDENAKRCFLLVSELHGYNKFRGMAFSRGITKKDQYLKIKKLDLNSNALKNLGGEYIFSAVEILNYAETGLSFEKVFENNESPWKIYLYKVL